LESRDRRNCVNSLANALSRLSEQRHRPPNTGAVPG
jgi:hypothetical protein